MATAPLLSAGTHVVHNEAFVLPVSLFEVLTEAMNRMTSLPLALSARASASNTACKATKCGTNESLLIMFVGNALPEKTSTGSHDASGVNTTHLAPVDRAQS